MFHPGWYWLMFAVAFTALVLVLRNMRGKTQSEEERAERELIEREIREGMRTQEGKVACIVCGKPATSHVPILGVSWLDKLNVFRDLWSLTPKYRRVDTDITATCAVDRDRVASIIDEECANMRRENAAHAAAQERKVAMLRAGGILFRARQQHEQTKASLDKATASVFLEAAFGPGIPLLTEGREEPLVVSVAPQTTNGKSTEHPPESLEVQS